MWHTKASWVDALLHLRTMLPTVGHNESPVQSTCVEDGCVGMNFEDNFHSSDVRPLI